MEKKKLAGFTLVEVLVTVAIVGILVAVGYPAYQNYVTRSRVAEALAFADAARTRVDIALASGAQPATDLLDSSGKKVDMMTALTWNAGKPGDPLVGYILAGMDLPGIGQRAVLALERRGNGDWHCVSAAPYAGATPALEADKLPASCRGDGGGGAMAKTAPPATGCPAGQVMTTATDSTGTSRQVCSAQQVAASLPAPATPVPAAAGPSSVAAAAGPTPATAPYQETCKSYEMHDANGICVGKPIPPQSQKPAITNNPCGSDGIWIPNTPASSTKSGPFTYPGLSVQAAPDFSKGPVAGGCAPKGSRQADVYADVVCSQCTGPIQICEQVHPEKTCSWPNNACGVHIKNNLDGTRQVTRGCMSQDSIWLEWYLGTSDEDKCDVIKNNQHVDYQCTFACTASKCNSGSGTGLRPSDDTLWKPR